MTPDLASLLALCEAATSNATLVRYEHGGGRLAIWPEAGRELVADFYDEANREFYAACSPDRIKELVERVVRYELTLRTLAEFDCTYDCTSGIGGHPVPCDCFKRFALDALTPHPKEG